MVGHSHLGRAQSHRGQKLAVPCPQGTLTLHVESRPRSPPPHPWLQQISSHQASEGRRVGGPPPSAHRQPREDRGAGQARAQGAEASGPVGNGLGSTWGASRASWGSGQGLGGRADLPGLPPGRSPGASWQKSGPAPGSPWTRRHSPSSSMPGPLPPCQGGKPSPICSPQAARPIQVGAQPKGPCSPPSGR